MLLSNLQNLGRKPNHCHEGTLTRKNKYREAELGKKRKGQQKKKKKKKETKSMENCGYSE
jgi:hypothetical protein